MMKRRTNTSPKKRKATVAVEFAVVFPVVMLFVLGIFELAAAYRVDAGLKIAMIRGLREASITTSTRQTIEDEITETLQLNGINAPSIQITPELVTESTKSIDIQISLSPTGENGFLFGQFYNRVMKKAVTLRRL